MHKDQRILLRPGQTPKRVGIGQFGCGLSAYSECCLRTFRIEAAITSGEDRLWKCFCGKTSVLMALGVPPTKRMLIRSYDDRLVQISDELVIAHWIECWTGLKNVVVMVNPND